MPRRPLTLPPAPSKAGKSNQVIKAFHGHAIEGLTVADYQRASLKCGSRFDCSKWLVDNVLRRLKRNAPLRLLDVGALRLSYAKFESIVQADYINLQAPPGDLAFRIKQQDYMTADFAGYDVIAFSLVLNFVGDPEARGQMLRKAAQEVIPGGLIYIVLPKAVIVNSSGLTEAILTQRLSLLKLRLVKSHFSPKLYYAVYQRDDSLSPDLRALGRPTGKIDFDIRL